MKGFVFDRYGAMLRYIDMPGDNRPLVFIHGLGLASSSHYPATVAQPSVAGHRRILIDLFGHGYSDAPSTFSYSLEDHAQTVAALLDHLGLKSCPVFGHSMGGAIAITLAAQRPELVACLMLAEPNLHVGGGFLSKFIVAYSEEEFVANGHRALVERVERLGFPTSVGSFRVCDSRGLYRSGVELVKGTKPNMDERFYAMRIPRTFIVGERSLPKDNRPDEDVEDMRKHNVPVHIVPNATHDMMMDNPPGVGEAIAGGLRYAAAPAGEPAA